VHDHVALGSVGEDMSLAPGEVVVVLEVERVAVGRGLRDIRFRLTAGG
jgi:hypothetical protein